MVTRASRSMPGMREMRCYWDARKMGDAAGADDEEDAWREAAIDLTGGLLCIRQISMASQ
jgi:hypothetical protein